ncbi:MAG: stage V sporulation protein AD [Bacilli bacterium]
MTNTYKNVYVLDTSTVVGPYEKAGPMGYLFDKTYDDLYIKEKSWEKAEAKLMDESVKILLNKTKMKSENINLLVAGDLLNQICASTYGLYKYDIPFLGIYNACATNCEGIIIASTFIDSKNIDNAIVSVSSHNMSSEKQFRNPTEYGAPKPHTATFTSTGGASIMLINKKTEVKVESSTIGTMCDINQKDANNMGAAMAMGAAKTIYKHLKDLNRDVNYYDLILTGDLGVIGKQILIEVMKEEYKIDLSKNYNDTGTMLYDLEKQKEVKSGGSGPVCNALVNYSYIYKLLKEKKLHKVLIVATGALFSPTSLFQKENIMSISHAVSLEA